MQLTTTAKQDLIRYIAEKYTTLGTTSDKEGHKENSETKAVVTPTISEDGLSIRWGGIYVNTGEAPITINTVTVSDHEGNKLFVNGKLERKGIIDQEYQYILHQEDSLNLSAFFSFDGL